MTCKDLMTSDPAVCLQSDNVVRAAMLMKQHNIGSIPVVASGYDGKLVGIVTDRDLMLRVIAEQRDYYTTRVDQVMTSDPVTCWEDDDYNAVLKAMKARQIRRIPVVDRDEKLVGIISQADIARTGDGSKTADVVEAISEPVGVQTGSLIARTSLMIAGGLSVGAGLVYWVREAAARAHPAAR